MKVSVFILLLCLLSIITGQQQQDLSAYSCHQCLSLSSSFWCLSSSGAGQCCSGSNFFTDKCTALLKRSGQCTNKISDQRVRYGACNYDKGRCGDTGDVILAGLGVTRVELPRPKTNNTILSKVAQLANAVCSYRLVMKDETAQQLVLRITKLKEVTVYVSMVQGSSAFDPVVGQSEEITSRGSYKYMLGENTQTLIVSLIIKDPVRSQVVFETYSIGHEQYGQHLKWMSVIIFSSTFGLYLFLVLTQKCRIVIQKHEADIQDYHNRKKLYKQFETEELFRRQRQLEDVTPLPAKLAPPGYETYFRNERGQLVPVKSSMMVSKAANQMGRYRGLERDSVEFDAETSQNMKKIMRQQLPTENSLIETLGQQTLQSTRGKQPTGQLSFLTTRNQTSIQPYSLSNKIAPAELIQSKTERLPYLSSYHDQNVMMNEYMGMNPLDRLSNGPPHSYHAFPHNTDYGNEDLQEQHPVLNSSPRRLDRQADENFYGNNMDPLRKSYSSRQPDPQHIPQYQDAGMRQNFSQRNDNIPVRDILPILRKRMNKGDVM